MRYCPSAAGEHALHGGGWPLARRSELATQLHELAQTVPILGCTTCCGVVLTDTWLTHDKAYALWLCGIADDADSYSTVHLDTRPLPLGEAVRTEVVHAPKLREDLHSFTILLGSPGNEEIIPANITAALSHATPILGGSSADNAVLSTAATALSSRSDDHDLIVAKRRLGDFSTARV